MRPAARRSPRRDSSQFHPIGAMIAALHAPHEPHPSVARARQDRPGPAARRQPPRPRPGRAGTRADDDHRRGGAVSLDLGRRRQVLRLPSVRRRAQRAAGRRLAGRHDRGAMADDVARPAWQRADAALRRVATDRGRHHPRRASLGRSQRVDHLHRRARRAHRRAVRGASPLAADADARREGDALHHPADRSRRRRRGARTARAD